MNVILLLALSVGSVLGYPSYQDKLPNGNNVNHPCKVNYRWPGLGHYNPLGGGERNSFGIDYANNGRAWTTALCQLDSDGDGRTNGQELGDPLCTWSPGQIPEITTGITHPGVCEPLDSPLCAGETDFLDCEVESFGDCPALQNDEILSTDFRFPEIQVPNTETNYFCMTHDLPSDQEYHLVAYEPLIDNANVMHHILLYGCKDPNGSRIDTPELCFMTGDNDCNELIGLWAVGVPGVCFPENLGFAFGFNGYSRVRMEAHYNNPDLKEGWTDKSGLRIYYQPTKPEFIDLYTMMIGQLMIEIPPGQARVPHVGTCPSDCTSKIIQKPAHIHSAFNHMHYLGRSMKIELFRDGKLAHNITNEDFYSYDNPIEHVHSPAIQLLPGDEIRTTCVFNSLSSNRWHFYGEGTNDEMCFGFLTIYPKDALPEDTSCISMGPLSACDNYFGTPVLGCDWKTFIDPRIPETRVWWEAVEKDCSYGGLCRGECKKTVSQVMAHPCMTSKDTRDLVNYFLNTFSEGKSLLAKLYSCSTQGDRTCTKDQCRGQCGSDFEYIPPNTASGVSYVATFCVVLASVFVTLF